MFNKWCLLVLRFTLKTLNLSYPLWQIDYKYENLYYNSFPRSFAFLSWQYGSQDEPSHLSFAHQGGWMLLEESTQPSTLSSLKTVTSLDPLSPHSYTLLSAVTCILHLTPTSDCPPSPLPSPWGTTAILYSESGSHLEDTPAVSAIKFVPVLSVPVAEKSFRWSNANWSTLMCWSCLPLSGPSLHRVLVFHPASSSFPLDWLFTCTLLWSSMAHIFLPLIARLSLLFSLLHTARL